VREFISGFVKGFLFGLVIVALIVVLGAVQVNADDGCPITLPLYGYTGDLDALVNGYCSHDGYFTPALITNSFYWTPTPQNIRTRALYQNDGIIEATAALKGIDLSDVDGNGIAFYTPSMAGWKVFLLPPDTDDWSLAVPARIVDVAWRTDTDYHVYWLRSGLELSYRLAHQFGAIDYIDANGDRYPQIRMCVTNENPEVVCADPPVQLLDWYIENARFVGDLTRQQALNRVYAKGE